MKRSDFNECNRAQEFIRDFEFGGGELQSLALMGRACFSTISTPPLGRSGGMPLQKNLKIDALRLILRHSGGTYSHSKVISTCTEYSRVMLKFSCENSWEGKIALGGGGISQVSPPLPPLPLYEPLMPVMLSLHHLPPPG